ncbi:c-type cytochrome [Cupriavidus sp. AU9028]|uniref:c-type cytochrome n=1 Tax=Cupriavidus sp. AU9028 TaxID=2871157 RepID=UPI001C98C235|nr:c-type cytochrome [Cupriavidus sp. AU9028]MBY4895810.1 c-type cytochrome [Cupriavidus sp. AU9028]
MTTLNTLCRAPRAFVLAAAVLAAPVTGAQAADIAAGKALVEKANCAACHGADMKTPIAPEYPKLAGQHESYLYHALVAYQISGNPQVGRANAIMQGQVNANPGIVGKDGKPRPFTRQELRDMAAYISSLRGDLVLKK